MTRAKGVVRLVQISDLHLGRSFGGLGLPTEVRDELARASMGALEHACRLVQERDAVALMIPGDLFDRPEVDEELVGRVQALFNQLDRPVLVSPGNHDAYGPMSVWNNKGLQNLGLSRWPENVHIFAGRALSAHTLLDGELVVYGHRVEGYHSVADSPLADVMLKHDARFKVLLIHGALDGAAYGSRTTVPFTAEQLVEIGADYAAVGHYHRHIPIEHGGRLLGAYAGVAVPGEKDEDPHGGVLVVTLTDADPELEYIDVYPGRIARLWVEGEPAFEDCADVCARVRTSASEQGLGSEDIVAIRLTGLSARALDMDLVEESLGSNFRHVVIADDTEPEIALRDPGEDTRVTVESQFILSMQSQIKQCDDLKRRKLLESALRYGRLALRGRSVRPLPAFDEADFVDHCDAN